MDENRSGTDPMRDKTSYITWDLMPALLSGCKNERDKLFFKLAISTGRRLGEIVPLRVQDIDFKNKTIAWNIEKKREDYRAILPADDALLNDLYTYIETNGIVDYVFQSSYIDNKPVSIRRWQQIFTEAIKNSGVRTSGGRKPHFHSLRHSVAVRILEERGDIRLVQRVLQHSDISITGHYLQVSPKDLREKMKGVLTIGE